MNKSIYPSIIVILISFLISILFSNYNLKNYDKIMYSDNGKKYHQMIKNDTQRYISHGAEIKNDLDNDIDFFKTGREHFTKYLPPRIVAIIFYTFDINYYKNFETKEVNTGVYKPYLFIQCLIYSISLLFFLFLTKDVFTKRYLFFIILFLAFEPNIFQYHGTFWSETYFFAFQIIIVGLILSPKKSIFNYFLIGFFLGLLTLQKQYAIFFIIPIMIYFFCYHKKKIYLNLITLVIAFFITQSFVGYNNLKRSGTFYFMANDNNIALHIDLVPRVINEIRNYKGNEFVYEESKIMKKWLSSNSIKYDENKVHNEHYLTYRDSIINEEDKLKFDNEIKRRTFMYFKKYPIEFTKKIIKHGIHITLLNPFHVYSDHNFESGEIYYYSQKHDDLLKYRIVYTLLVYLICLYGVYRLALDKNYKLLFLLFISIFYFYFLSFWHGNTRYYMPVYIYFAFFFARTIEIFHSKLKQ